MKIYLLVSFDNNCSGVEIVGVYANQGYVKRDLFRHQQKDTGLEYEIREYELII